MINRKRNEYAIFLDLLSAQLSEADQPDQPVRHYLANEKYKNSNLMESMCKEIVQLNWSTRNEGRQHLGARNVRILANKQSGKFLVKPTETG